MRCLLTGLILQSSRIFPNEKKMFFLCDFYFCRYSSRYGRGGNDYDYGNDYEETSSTRTPKSRFRSRFVRSHQQEDSDNEQSRGVRFNEKEKEKERERVLDTEFVSRGNLSGIIRLADSPRVMKRLQEQDRPKKEKKEVAPPQPKAAVQQPKRPTATAPTAAQRQMSEDEIDRIKRQNKGSTSTTTPTTTPAATTPSIPPAVEPER